MAKNQFLDFLKLKRRLKIELERAERYAHSLSLVRIVLDNLKVLKRKRSIQKLISELKRVFTNDCRGSDVVGGYGKEELALILPETDVSGAFVVAERMRNKVATEEFGKERRLTLSAGISSYPLHAANLNDLIKEADRALEVAKVSGNRVCAPGLET